MRARPGHALTLAAGLLVGAVLGATLPAAATLSSPEREKVEAAQSKLAEAQALLAEALTTPTATPTTPTPSTSTTPAPEPVDFAAGAEDGVNEFCFKHSAVDAGVGPSTDQAREGTRSYRVEVRDGATIYGTERSEFSNGPGTCAKDKFVMGEETWTAVSVYLPAGFPTYTHWSLVTQWKEPGGGSPPSQINLSNDQWVFYGPDTGARYKAVLGAAQRGVWTDFLFHHRWSDDPTVGFVEAFINGQVVQPKRMMATMEPGSDPLFLSVGHYRDTSPTSGTAVLYVDAVRVGATRAAVEPR